MTAGETRPGMRLCFGSIYPAVFVNQHVTMPRECWSREVVLDIKPQAQWIYDAAEHRMKHCGSNPEPCFVLKGSAFIGLCPNTLTKAQAATLLRDAEFPGKGNVPLREYPKKIWNVHEGVIYEASPTDTGKGSYHGYPWRGRPGRNRLPRDVEKALRAKAEAQGFGRKFQEWLDDYNA